MQDHVKCSYTLIFFLEQSDKWNKASQSLSLRSHSHTARTISGKGRLRQWQTLLADSRASVVVGKRRPHHTAPPLTAPLIRFSGVELLPTCHPALPGVRMQITSLCLAVAFTLGLGHAGKECVMPYTDWLKVVRLFGSLETSLLRMVMHVEWFIDCLGWNSFFYFFFIDCWLVSVRFRLISDYRRVGTIR